MSWRTIKLIEGIDCFDNYDYYNNDNLNLIVFPDKQSIAISNSVNKSVISQYNSPIFKHKEER